MCGIAGLLHFDAQPADPLVVRRMTDALAHRGPDGEGVFVDGSLGLGHRRLAIIDLSDAGRQPMTLSESGLTISFNGEIYNYRELRRELTTLGCRFRSRTDTEVILHAYAVWGESCLNRFNGMFAFAIWDARRRELFLARDRYGIKPLYYGVIGNAFRFASEQKGILASTDGRRELDVEALVEYFTFQNLFTDRTLYRDIKMFPAASWAKVQASGRGEVRPVRYWDYTFDEPDQRLEGEEYARELDRLMVQAVRRQLVSDVEVGAYLSGGLDSGAITAIAAQSQPFLKSFTCGFDLHSASGMELAFDERRKAEHMSYLYRTEHYEMVLKAGDMERVFPTLAFHMEEPRVGQSYPNFYMAKLASKFVKVVLSGTGGDEIFAGYPWRYYRAATETASDDVDAYYAFWQRLIPGSMMEQLFAPIWGEARRCDTREIFRSVLHDRYSRRPQRPEDAVNRSLYFEAKTFLHGILVMEDKLTMAHGVELRVPFLDNDLVDFAMRLPTEEKLHRLHETIRLNENLTGDKKTIYNGRTKDGKMLLRKVLERYMPSDITDGAKQGFSAPDASWFKGESLEYVRREILSPTARIKEFFDPSVVDSLVNDHLEGRENRRLLIWSLLSFEWWLRTFQGDASQPIVPLTSLERRRTGQSTDDEWFVDANDDSMCEDSRAA